MGRARRRCLRWSRCAAGGFQSLAVTDSGAAYSWGWGESGSIGHGNREHQYTPKLIEALAGGRVVQASAGSGHALFLTDDGALHACGDFRHGKLGLGKAISEDALSPQLVPFPKGVRVAQCSAWHAHSLTVTAAGELFSFGCGEDGRLGHGDEKAHWRPTAVKFFHAGLRVKYAALPKVEAKETLLQNKERLKGNHVHMPVLYIGWLVFEGCCIRSSTS